MKAAMEAETLLLSAQRDEAVAKEKATREEAAAALEQALREQAGKEAEKAKAEAAAAEMVRKKEVEEVEEKLKVGADAEFALSVAA
eukprot:6176947-Pleurochrysis_carterae.AAC.1